MHNATLIQKLNNRKKSHPSINLTNLEKGPNDLDIKVKFITPALKKRNSWVYGGTAAVQYKFISVNYFTI